MKFYRITMEKLLAAFLFMATGVLLTLPPAIQAAVPVPGSGPTALDSWSFYDDVNWTSDQGYAPISFTNLSDSPLGDGESLVMESTNPAVSPVWLQYNIYEPNGATNLTVDAGTVAFWFAPNWASTNQGGSGPGEWGRLVEVGGYSPDSSYGWWSVMVDDVGQNIYFAAQTNDLSSTVTTYLSAPISWTTNYWHYIVLTYSATNTTLYLDGVVATNGPPVTVYPGPDVLANGFGIGSDTNGVLLAQGMFNSIQTYNTPLNGGTISDWFHWQYGMYLLNPWNSAMANVVSAPSNPSSLPNTYDIITGQGNLQLVGSAISCSYGTNAYQVWLTNITATAVGSGTNMTMNVTFTIEGGADGTPYDVFANSVLSFGPNGTPWAWMGQGYHCNIYTLTNLPPTATFLILGTPQDSDQDGLTDAYELLVSKTNPNNADTDGDGISDSDEILNGSNPLVANPSWKLDTDGDGLPDFYETSVGWQYNVAEPAPGLPSYSAAPIP